MKTPLKVLVLTDRFPPEAEGGAEISLHDTLHAMDPEQFDVRVLTFGKSEARQDGIPVSRMPEMVDWPRRSLGMPSNSSNLPGKVSAAIMDLWERPSSAGLIGSLALRKALRSPYPHPGSDYDMVATSPFQRDQLKVAIRAFEPDVIHADNLKSILLLQTLSEGSFGKVAMVRDHRFFCSHAHQSMLIADRPCEQCQFGCVEGKPGGNLVRRAMARNKAFRMQALCAYDEVVTTSRFLAEFIERAAPEHPITAIGNPHPDLHMVSAATKTANRTAKPSILFSGNLRHEKGAIFFAEVLSKLSDIDGLRVTFAGRGPEKDRLMEIVQMAGMADKVSFPGFVDLDVLYQMIVEATVVVAPTLWPEPFGRLPLEAGLLGRPVVASAAGGHLETIIDGETGILFPVGDKDQFCAALRELLENPDRADALGRSAKSHVLEAFDPLAVAQRLGNIWRQANKASPKSG